jgi:SAM-dependent MidA family methyltransferase
LLDHIATLAGRGDAASVGRIQALKTLLLPPMMGDRFRVLLQRKGLTRIPLPGFGETVGQTGS